MIYLQGKGFGDCASAASSTYLAASIATALNKPLVPVKRLDDSELSVHIMVPLQRQRTHTLRAELSSPGPMMRLQCARMYMLWPDHGAAALSNL